MANAFVINTSVSTLGRTITAQTIINGEGGSYIDTSELSAATNKEYSIAFPYQRLLAIAMWCNIDCVLEFNDATTGVPTISLVGGKAFVLEINSYAVNPFTANVTKVYATNGGAFELKIYPVIDPSP